MASERKIEKLLRAYAKKRRADAGDPLKLHPATRRRLQGEIARHASRPEDEEASVTLWELFRQHWAVLVGFAVIIFFGAALFLPALSSAKKKAQSGTAMNNLKQIGLAAQMTANENYGNLPSSLDALTNELGSDKVLTDPETGKPFIYLAAGEKLEQLSSNAVLAYSAADKKDHAVLFADGRVEVVNGRRLAALTNRGRSQLVASDDSASRQLAKAPAEFQKDDGSNAVASSPAPALAETDRSVEKPAASGIAGTGSGTLAANAPASAAPALDLRTKPPGVTASDFAMPAGSIQFASYPAQNNFRNTAAPAKTGTAVLANFQVQQNGSAIRVVDADGSFYDGSLQTEGEAAQTISVQTAIPAPTGTAPAKNEQRKTIATRDELQAAQNYFFQVAGTNQTLKQKVVFSGNLVVMPSAMTNAEPSSRGTPVFGGGEFGGSPQSSHPNQLPWSNSRIAGTAVVAGTNRIEINAAPQSP